MRTTELLFAVTIAVLLAGCQKNQARPVSASEAPPVRVNVIEVEPRPFISSVTVTGTLVSTSQVDVKAETTGRLVKFPKEEGARVEAGEAVAWVDDESYGLAVRQAESVVEVARAALGRAKILDDHSRIEVERARNLVSSGGITDRDLKAAELAEQDARAQVLLAQAQLDQAQAALQVTLKRQRDTVIRAPVAGDILRKYINAGAYVEPPTPVFSLVDNSRLELDSPVAASELAPIRRGQQVSFHTSSYADAIFKGSVIDVAPAVDPQSRSAKVRIRVDNPDGRLKAGMFAEGEILTGVREQAVIIPSAAVYREDQEAKESFVYVIEDGRAALRRVKVGRERNSSLEILSGLSAGDLLIARQSIELADGVRVEPLR